MNAASFSVAAIPIPGVPTPDCPIFQLRWEVPNGALLYNGQTGDYYPPLYLTLQASDPEGSTVTVQWFCLSGSQQAVITDLGGGYYSCDPIYTPNSKDHGYYRRV